ncbi:MAG TPA: UPF0147 family protein, partial [Nitrososphaeraceae archaeon]|nr:UPF0147 family protein [Nitrososphaeraceae archaeon]
SRNFVRTLLSKGKGVIADQPRGLRRYNKNTQVNLSVRAANVISTLDELTRNRRTESYIRTILWQVVSNLECVRER